MKTKIYFTAVIALIFSACTTGSYVTTRYVDDIYFNPRDVPPPVVVEEAPEKAAAKAAESPDRVIISEITRNDEGSQTMNNYIFDGKDASGYADAQHYNLEQMDLESTDTTVYYDDNEIKYVINNYYDGSDIDFSYRIHRFHRPYFYDPFYWNDWYWDSWYYPYSSLYWDWGWGWNSWGYSPWYSGWYGGWYNPYSYWGWGGFGYPGYAWNYPYYNNWGWGYYDRDDFRYGKRRDYNTMVRGGGGTGGSLSRTSALSNDRSSLKSTGISNTGVVSGTSDRGRSISGVEGGGREARGIQGSENNSTITNLRRNSEGSGTTPASTSVTSRRYTGTQGQYTRPATENIQGSGTNAYTPRYNQQRSSTRSSYNVQEYSRPSGSSGTTSGTVKNATRSTTVYSRPSGSSSSDRSYRSGSTYNRSSSSGANTSRSYSTPSGSGYSGRSSGSSYSAPSNSSRSYSSPSGNYSSGSSGGGYSGGGGGSHSGGSTSSHSGRR